MKKPPIISPEDDLTVLGKFFKTPIVVKGMTWIPLAEMFTGILMTVITKKNHPHWPRQKCINAGVWTSIGIWGTEWCHNLTHTAVASWIGKPVDAIRILWGQPMLFYKTVNDETVSPRQHILRALAGPLINYILLPIALIYRRFTKPDSVAREFANSAVGMNAFIASGAFLPIPFLDGGPILKWSLVERGKTIAEADEAVQRVNLVTGSGLGVATGIAMKKRRWFIGGILAMFALSSIVVGLGMVKEE